MTEDERQRHEQAVRDMEATREALEIGQLWVQCPHLHPDHPNYMILEIRGFVDNVVVYRFWMKHKGYFGYNHASLYSVALNTGIAKGYSDDPMWVKAHSQEWGMHGVNPDDDDLVG